MNYRAHFGRHGPNPTVVGVAFIATISVIVLLVLYLTKTKPIPPHAPDVVAVIVSGIPGKGKQQDFQKLLAYAGNRGDILIVASARHPDVAQSDPLAGKGINNLERQKSQARAEQAAEQQYEAAIAPGGNTDLQRSFNAVDDILHTVRHKRVWVAALGPVTAVAHGVQLDDPLTRGDPATSIAGFSGGFVPSCSGWDLYVAAGGVQPSSLAEDQVQEYWRRLMRSCGGRLTAWTIHIGNFPSAEEVPPWNGPGRCAVTFELEGRTLFNTGEFRLLHGADKTLNGILRRVADAGGSRLRIGGYTDDKGPAPYNQTLSVHRAQAVADWFLARGIDPARMTAKGHGEANPVASNGTEEGRQLNRRVEVTLLYRRCAPGATL
jgi:outer membrane protein OmpA-like peptidoglycan-associated protein